MTDPLADAFATHEARRAARRALADARPGRAPVDCRSLGRGNRKRTALVTLDDEERIVVQVSTDVAAMRTERALLDLVGARTSVPVPDVLGGATAGDAAALVTAHVPGANLHEEFVAADPATQRDIVRSFGRFLAELHEACRFEGYGRVTISEESGPTATEADWGEWLASYGRRGLARLPSAFDDLRPALAGLFDDVAPSSPPARLFPWDFRPGNAVVDDGAVAAVLDWEAPLSAAPALSVAKAEYLVVDWYVPDPERLRPAFVAGYQRVRPVPTVRPVHRAAAVCQSAVDSTGAVTNPRYPELDREAAVAFHHRALERVLRESGAE